MIATHRVACTNCGYELSANKDGMDVDISPCPQCRSKEQTVQLSAHDSLTASVKEAVRGKVKEPNRKSKDKLRRDFFRGDERHKKSGKWYKKSRDIDKDKNLYQEKVTDPETGKVVHECEEPLTNHQGHGTARKKKTDTEA